MPDRRDAVVSLGDKRGGRESADLPLAFKGQIASRDLLGKNYTAVHTAAEVEGNEIAKLERLQQTLESDICV